MGRRHMTVELKPSAEPPIGLQVRHPGADDTEALAALMLDAYSAVLVSRHDDMPLIAYAMTAASHKGRGLATALTERSLSSLHAAGELNAHLWVTRGNTPAERIYERLGFRDAAG